jgi:hypothetical protein
LPIVGPEFDPKSAQIHPQNNPKNLPLFGSKVGQKFGLNHPKIGPKSSQNQPRIVILINSDNRENATVWGLCKDWDE